MENKTTSIPQRWAVPFFTIWTGQAFSLFGSSLVQFALVWWLTQKTGSATVLATATLVALLPQIIFAPFIGALVDRWNRRLIMIVADGSIALATAFLFYVCHRSSPGLANLRSHVHPLVWRSIPPTRR
ncbi:MAG: MFS transporter [Anaerolineales bacterium]